MAGHAELRVLWGGREAFAWCEERERLGVVYIVARASTIKERIEALP